MISDFSGRFYEMNERNTVVKVNTSWREQRWLIMKKVISGMNRCARTRRHPERRARWKPRETAIVSAQPQRENRVSSVKR